MSGRGARSGWAAAGTGLAGVVMIINGLMNVLGGITGIRKDNVYAVIGRYAFSFNTTAWGWIHLVLGIIVTLAGFALLAGAVWARAVAIGLSALVMLGNFIWLPYQPVWSVIMIAMALFVIWALFVDVGEHEVPGDGSSRTY